LPELHVGCNNIPTELLQRFIAMDKFDVLCAVPVKELKADAITELDLSGKSLGLEGASVLSAYLKDNSALANVKLNQVSLPIQEIKTARELDFSGKGLKVEDIIIIASCIQSSRALESLDLSNNDIFAGVRDEGPMPALAEALEKNTCFKTLNISSNCMTAIHAQILAVAMKNMGSLGSLNVSTNNIREQGCSAFAAVLNSTRISDLNIAQNHLTHNHDQAYDFTGIGQLSCAIKDNRTLTSINILANDIGVARAQELVQIKEAKPMLKTLCGWTMEETALDVSKQNLRSSDAVLLASDVQNHRAVSRLNLSGNVIGGWPASPAAMTALGAALKVNGTITELNISENDLKAKDIPGFAENLNDNGALTSVDIRGNDIGSEQEGALKCICDLKSIVLHQ
jgi:Ran GTPase-activating protein (RanGAP) involved in mRNA processing and transport